MEMKEEMENSDFFNLRKYFKQNWLDHWILGRNTATIAEKSIW